MARFREQLQAAEWLPEYRVCICCRYVRFGKVEPGWGPRVVMRPGSAKWLDVAVCSSVWNCPVCAAYITERRRQLLNRGMERWHGEGGRFLMVTYTIPHTYQDALESLLLRFKRAMVRMAESRAYKALVGDVGRIHSVKSLEVTVGADSGWHPHRHDAWFLVAGGPLSEVQLQKRLAPLWVKACVAEGLVSARGQAAQLARSVKVQVGYASMAEYVAKWGHVQEWTLVDELTKGNVKKGRSGGRYTPFGLLCAAVAGEDDPQLREWFREYAAAFKGCRQLVWSDGAHLALCGEDEPTDDAILQDESGFVEEVRTQDAEWLAVTRAGAQGRVLEVAAAGGKWRVLAYLRELVLAWCGGGEVELEITGRYRLRSPVLFNEPAPTRDFADDQVPPMSPLTVGPWPALPEPVPPDLREYGIDPDDWEF